MELLYDIAVETLGNIAWIVLAAIIALQFRSRRRQDRARTLAIYLDELPRMPAWFRQIGSALGDASAGAQTRELLQTLRGMKRDLSQALASALQYADAEPTQSTLLALHRRAVRFEAELAEPLLAAIQNPAAADGPSHKPMVTAFADDLETAVRALPSAAA